MKNSNFNLEKKLFSERYDFVIGVDEAGRGPLAGPVVAAAVVLRCHSGLACPLGVARDPESKEILKQVQDDKMWGLVRDSKKLSAKQRERIFDFICENFYIGVGICDHKTIDRINILEASFLAMKKATQKLMHNMNRKDTKHIILVDGNKKIPNFSMEQKAIVGGDGKVKSISAASIIAKVTRDRIMLKMHAKYSQYNFGKHKGYGTKLHMDALSKYGPCAIHRQSFTPVKNVLEKSVDIKP